MGEKRYKIKYIIINYTFEFLGETHGHMEIKEEIVNEVELCRIEMQAEEGLTIIEEKKLLNPEMLPPMKRIIEYIDSKGKHKGWGLKKRK